MPAFEIDHFRRPHWYDKWMLKALHLLPPEFAHNIAKKAMEKCFLAPGPICVSKGLNNLPAPMYMFDNPLGLAAGFDKNGLLVRQSRQYGFGFIEVGSITNRGGPGNKKPRLWRRGDYDLVNRMGLNGDPAAVVATRLRKSWTDGFQNFGINIAKTHNPSIVDDEAIDDVVAAYRWVTDIGAYHVINISCPNTTEGLTFEEPDALRSLLVAVNKVRKGIPLFLKLSPALAQKPKHLARIFDIAVDMGIQGFVFSNTIPSNWRGVPAGESGTLVFYHTCKLLQAASYDLRLKDMLFIACGGIMSVEHLYILAGLGANLFQVYTGFVTGPNAGLNFAEDLLYLYSKHAEVFTG